MQRSLSSATALRKAPDPPARRHSPSLARKTRSAQPQAVAAEPYCFAEWRVRRVGVDYHIEVDAHFYSVPHRFARSAVEVRLTPQTVEIFSKGERIAAHRRGSGNHGHTTPTEHMPSSHRRYADWTIERIRRAAASIGPAIATLCNLILERLGTTPALAMEISCCAPRSRSRRNIVVS
jgi:transposase